MSLDQLLKSVRACEVCRDVLPLGPRPIVQAHPSARLLIIGQAPGRKVHETGIPWNDASGNRLRGWLNLTPQQFYDPHRTALVPMGFCYPGKGGGGDMPPRPECAPLWHQKLGKALPNIALTLLIGTYAQAYYLGPQRKATLGHTVAAWREYLTQGYLPLVHPSPRNQSWLQKNLWFEKELVPELQKITKTMKL